MATNKKFVAKNGLIAPDAEFTGVTSITLPAGTTAERPQNPVSGMVRFNTDVGALESYDGVDWIEVGDVDTEGFATATQGILAITALQPGDNLSDLSGGAASIAYNNAASGLNATNIQDAIDELVALIQST